MRKTYGTPTNLTHSTAAQVELPAVFHAVAAGLDRYETFLSYTVPVGMQVVIGKKPVLMLRLYDAGGVLFTSGRMLIGLLKVRKQLVNAWNDIPDLNVFASLTWLEQSNKENRESITIDTSYSYCLCFEGEQIVFQVYNASHAVPLTPHASTKMKLPVYISRAQDVLRAVAKGEGK